MTTPLRKLSSPNTAGTPETRPDSVQSASVGRRQFVQSVTVVLTGFMAGLNRGWAIDLHAVSQDQSAILLAMIHTIAPHDGLDEAAYALVVAGVDAEAAKSAAYRNQLDDGLSLLGPSFAHASEPERVQKLEAIEGTPFFQSVRLTTLSTLYNNPIAWAHFGYEGEAFSKGGYLLRGFNDLKWLPEVPLVDSGPMPV